jgi:hypothetical protein
VDEKTPRVQSGLSLDSYKLNECRWLSLSRGFFKYFAREFLTVKIGDAYLHPCIDTLYIPGSLSLEQL